VAAPSLAGFKARLDGALSTLGWWKMSLLMAGGLEAGDLGGPFQPKPICDSIHPDAEALLHPYERRWQHQQGKEKFTTAQNSI